MFFYYGYISSRLRTGGEPEGFSRGLAFAKKHMASLGLPRKMLRQFLEKVSRFDPRKFDIYWAPNMALMPGFCEKSRFSVLTLHDFSWLLYPEWHPRERVKLLEKIFPPGLERADRIITGSRFIREQGVKFFGLDPHRIEVIHHGVDHDLFRPYPKEDLENFRKNRGLPRRFVLFTGTLEPRKNVVRLVEAFLNLSGKLRSSCSLVLAGARGWRDAAILESLERGGASVHPLGYVSSRELAFLYNLAEIFVYPSLYEGFGLPPLEAMACGTPVVTGNNSSLPEVCGTGAIYVNAENSEEISASLEILLENPELRNRMIRAGLRQAERFSWDIAARKHREIFASLLEG